MVHCASRLFEELHAFLRVCVRFFRGETALRLLEIVMVKSNRLVGSRLLPFLRERLVEDLAFLRRLTA